MIDIFHFLMPKELFQSFFIFTILFSVLLVWILLIKYAHEESWNLNWENNTPDDDSDDLTIDHGSVTDLSSAVATKIEKVAVMLPGILLTFGLLGTFIGLGIALNNAANTMLYSGQEDQMNFLNKALPQLSSMMNNLGTKFKTSTWGIIGYLIMTLINSWFNFEGKRLKFCVQKFNQEFRINKNHQEKLNDIAQNKILDALTKIYLENKNTRSSIQEFTQHAVKFVEENRSLSTQLIGTADRMSKVSQSLDTIHQKLHQSIDKKVESLYHIFENSFEQYSTVSNKLILEMKQMIKTSLEKQEQDTKKSQQNFVDTINKYNKENYLLVMQSIKDEQGILISKYIESIQTTKEHLSQQQSSFLSELSTYHQEYKEMMAPMKNHTKAMNEETEKILNLIVNITHQIKSLSEDSHQKILQSHHDFHEKQLALLSLSHEKVDIKLSEIQKSFSHFIENLNTFSQDLPKYISKIEVELLKKIEPLNQSFNEFHNFQKNEMHLLMNHIENIEKNISTEKKIESKSKK